MNQLVDCDVYFSHGQESQKETRRRTSETSTVAAEARWGAQTRRRTRRGETPRIGNCRTGGRSPEIACGGLRNGSIRISRSPAEFSAQPNLKVASLHDQFRWILASVGQPQGTL